jgi:hypothetical protein
MQVDAHIGAQELHLAIFGLLTPVWKTWTYGHEITFKSTTLRIHKNYIPPSSDMLDVIWEYFLKTKGCLTVQQFDNKVELDVHLCLIEEAVKVGLNMCEEVLEHGVSGFEEDGEEFSTSDRGLVMDSTNGMHQMNVCFLYHNIICHC